MNLSVMRDIGIGRMTIQVIDVATDTCPEVAFSLDDALADELRQRLTEFIEGDAPYMQPVCGDDITVGLRCSTNRLSDDSFTLSVTVGGLTVLAEMQESEILRLIETINDALE